MNLSKQQLEELIREEKTLGNYVFDEDKKCFYGDVEVELYIAKVAENKYKSVCYYFDRYEVWVDEDEVEFFEGNEETAKQVAIDSFNQAKFMDYPIILTNINCELYEDEG